jgi:hypothetical protein
MEELNPSNQADEEMNNRFAYNLPLSEAVGIAPCAERFFRRPRFPP